MHWVIRNFKEMPKLMRVGMVILIVGGVLDLIYHASPSNWESTLEIYLGTEAYYAHLVTLVGMIVSLLGAISGKAASRTEPDHRVKIGAVNRREVVDRAKT